MQLEGTRLMREPRLNIYTLAIAMMIVLAVGQAQTLAPNRLGWLHGPPDDPARNQLPGVAGVAPSVGHFYQGNATRPEFSATMGAPGNQAFPSPGGGSRRPLGKQSSPVTETWAKTYFNSNAAGSDYGTAVAVDSFGNTFVAGGSTSGSYGSDFFTMKYDATGNLVWSARYNGPANLDDVPSAIKVDASGNVYVTGRSISQNGNFDYATIKYNSNGVQQWVARYDGPASGEDTPSALVVDGSGNVYVTGSSVGTTSDFATVKYNSSGVQQWVARYDNGFDDFGNTIALDASGNIYVSGTSGQGTTTDMATVKYNSSGVQQWVARYDGGYSDGVYAMVLDGSGNVYVGGYSYAANLYYGFTTVKYNSAGVQQWVGRYNSSATAYEFVRAIALDASGNVYVAGVSYVTSTGYDYLTVKYNSAGVQQWFARYDGGSTDYVYGMVVDGPGNAYVVGYSYQGAPSAPVYLIVKYNAAGVQQWTGQYKGPVGGTADFPSAVVMDNSGNVTVTGQSNSTTSIDFGTVRFSPAGIRVWVARYDGASGGPNDYATQMAVDGAGNVYVLGYSYSGTVNVGIFADLLTVKYNSSGVQQWVARFDGGNGSNDVPVGIGADASGNVYVVGTAQLGNTSDYVTVKYNSAGAQQWAVRYDNGTTDNASAMAVDAAGNVFVTGQSLGGTFGISTVKYNTSGVQQWLARYETASPVAITLDKSGNIYLTGTSYASTNSALAVKYNSAGVQQWASTYKTSTTANEAGKGIAVDGSGNVFMLVTSTPTPDNVDYVTVKYNSTGTQQWASRFDNGSSDYPYAIGVDGSGNVYVTGYSRSPATLSYDCATLKYNSSGVQQWMTIYDDGYSDMVYSMAVGTTGNVYITGYSYRSNYVNDCQTIKYNSAGQQQWVGRYNGGVYAQGNVVVIDKGENVYVAGKSNGAGWSIFLTVKYDSTTGTATVNAKPVLNSRTPTAVSQVSRNSPQTFTVSVSDPNGDPITFTWKLNNAVVKSGTDTSFTLTSTDPHNTPETVNVVFSDPGGLKDSTTWNFTITGVGSQDGMIPKEFGLSQNYPNPFNPSTIISYQLATAGRVMLRIFNAIGQEVAVLVNEQKDPGTYSARWDAQGVPSGIYFYRLQAGDRLETRKMVYVR
jgi:uncharacterized delta-60 repeat protein